MTPQKQPLERLAIWEQEFPPKLSDDENEYLIRKYKKTEDEDARKKIRNALICGNLRLVLKVAQEHCKAVGTYYSMFPDREDFLQEATLYIAKTLDQFDETRGAKFSTFIGSRVRLAYKSSMDDRKAKKRDQIPQSFSDVVLEDQKGDRDKTLGDTIEDMRFSEDRMVAKLDYEYIMNKILPTLKERDAKMFLEYYVQNHTMQKIADQYGISRQAVLKILKRTKSEILDKYENGIERSRRRRRTAKFPKKLEKTLDRQM